ERLELAFPRLGDDHVLGGDDDPTADLHVADRGQWYRSLRRLTGPTVVTVAPARAPGPARVSRVAGRWCLAARIVAAARGEHRADAHRARAQEQGAPRRAPDEVPRWLRGHAQTSVVHDLFPKPRRRRATGSPPRPTDRRRGRPPSRTLTGDRARGSGELSCTGARETR